MSAESEGLHAKIMDKKLYDLYGAMYDQNMINLVMYTVNILKL